MPDNPVTRHSAAGLLVTDIHRQEIPADLCHDRTNIAKSSSPTGALRAARFRLRGSASAQSIEKHEPAREVRVSERPPHRLADEAWPRFHDLAPLSGALRTGRTSGADVNSPPATRGERGLHRTADAARWTQSP